MTATIPLILHGIGLKLREAITSTRSYSPLLTEPGLEHSYPIHSLNCAHLTAVFPDISPLKTVFTILPYPHAKSVPLIKIFFKLTCFKQIKRIEKGSFKLLIYSGLYFANKRMQCKIKSFCTLLAVCPPHF